MSCSQELRESTCDSVLLRASGETRQLTLWKTSSLTLSISLASSAGYRSTLFPRLALFSIRTSSELSLFTSCIFDQKELHGKVSFSKSASAVPRTLSIQTTNKTLHKLFLPPATAQTAIRMTDS